MEFGLSQEQGLLQDSIARFVKDQVSLETVRAVAGGSQLRSISLDWPVRARP